MHSTPMPHWDDYRFFLALARAGTLAASARKLGIEHTTVSRRIAALEARLGARLFDRTSKGYALTPAGERMLESAATVEEAMFGLEHAAAGEDRRIEGTVRVAASETLAVGFLAARLAPLRATHPGVDIELVTGTQRVNLLRREADVALRIGTRPAQQNLVIRKLASLAWAVYGSEAYLSRRTDAAKDAPSTHDWVGFDEEIVGITAARWLAQQGTEGRVGIRTNSIPAILAACRAGVGLAPLPCFLADPEPLLVRLAMPPMPPNDLWLLVHADLQRVARVRTVIDFIVDAVARDLHMLEGRPTRPPTRRAPISRPSRRA